ncbi:MAG TPA: DUF1361 domain-containing protein, partial [Bacteroidia bacterium]|nr:DUF1361 domain-containing protein [Bacteroidia bacterium]
LGTVEPGFNFSGLILGFLSLYRIHHILNMYLKQTWAWFSMVMMLFLCGYGVYLGRFSRYNSWDIMCKPHNLFNEIYMDFRYPVHNIEAFAFSATTALLMLACYLSLVVFKTYSHDKQ